MYSASDQNQNKIGDYSQVLCESIPMYEIGKPLIVGLDGIWGGNTMVSVLSIAVDLSSLSTQLASLHNPASALVNTIVYLFHFLPNDNIDVVRSKIPTALKTFLKSGNVVFVGNTSKMKNIAACFQVQLLNTISIGKYLKRYPCYTYIRVLLNF